MKTPPKPGWKTTEFWLTLITSVASVAGAMSGYFGETTAAILTTVSTAGYTLSRGIAKT